MADHFVDITEMIETKQRKRLESFEKLSIMSFRLKGEILNYLKS